jgi:hypothetical protein
MAFNPDTNYFQHMHLWVLLPGLPLFLWNEGALRAIGDSLGKFIAIDPQSLTGPMRKMGRVLVEMDICAGLPEILEIEWRGRKIAQTLDYLGLPFRCNRCRKTGHLRRSCLGKDLNEPTEDDDLLLNPPEYVDEDPSLSFLEVPSEPLPPPSFGQCVSFSDKIKQHCPLLFNSLSDTEKEALNNSLWLSSSTCAKNTLLESELPCNTLFPPNL